MKFSDVFNTEKPIMGMLHLKGDSPDDILCRAQKEADLMTECGVDALIVEDYFGEVEDVYRVLEWLQNERPDYCYGVNILQQFEKSYEAAVKYGAKFMQIDSVAGHLSPEDDVAYGKMCESYKAKNDICILGGVRFKYQPVLSGRSVKEDLELGMRRCDAIVVTGDGTGMNTNIEKIREFRDIMGDYPLIVGAGLTVNSVSEQLSVGDGAIVGSTFKEGGDAHNDVCAENVQAFMEEVRKLRQDK